MRIACVSDLHENLPTIPECEVLCIAGDLTFGFKGDLASQQRWLLNEFREWIEQVPAEHVVCVAGNHDQCIESWGWPEVLNEVEKLHYLEDSGVELDGVKFWGTPWQPWFYSWAFNAPERHGEEFLTEKFAMIPADTDVVVCHGPPLGYGDQVGDPFAPDRSRQPRVGSGAMTARLLEVQPRLMVCGHIHSGYGKYTMWHGVEADSPCTVVRNAALVNNEYKPVNDVMVHRL